MMMELDDQSRIDLVKYRIARSRETLKEAELLAREKFYNAAINRLYYACYYASVALLLNNRIRFKRDYAFEDRQDSFYIV